MPWSMKAADKSKFLYFFLHRALLRSLTAAIDGSDKTFSTAIPVEWMSDWLNMLIEAAEECPKCLGEPVTALQWASL